MHNRSRHWNRVATMAAASWLALYSTATAFSSPSRSPVDLALDSAVRLDVVLTWPGRRPQTAEFGGSGWTRACTANGRDFELVVATAGHVVDTAELAREARPTASTSNPVVKVVVIYRDGRRYIAGRDDLRVDRVHDYGEVHVLSPIPRTVLPAGEGAAVGSGTPLFTIASPGRLEYAYFDGALMLTSCTMVSNAPQGAWLSSVPVAPGASGAPVMTLDGHVVATVVGLVEWPWGGTASVIVSLPASLGAIPFLPLSDSSLPATSIEDVNTMGFFEGWLPFVKLGAVGAGLTALLHMSLSSLIGRGGFSSDTLALVTDICRKVVLAVEQAHGQLSGPDKKQLAEQMIGEIMSHLGINVPKALIDAAIESSVLLANALLTSDAQKGAAA